MEKGFVLITTLLLIMLLSLMVISSLEINQQAVKINKLVIVHKENFDKAQVGLVRGEKNLRNYKNPVLGISVTVKKLDHHYHDIISRAGSVTLESTVYQGSRQSWREVI